MNVTIKDNSGKAKEEMAAAIERALTAVGLQAETHAKLELENDPRRIDTGNLRNSISNTVKDDAAYIGTNVEYAPYVHEGTRRMAPNRFLRNAVEKNVEEYKQIIKNYMQT